MFKVVYNNRIGAHTVRDVKKAHVYLHSDGAVFDTPEYWPTKELAQAVLDKWQPKHVWEHGDVFNPGSDGQYIMLYLCPRYGDKQVVHLNHHMIAGCAVRAYLKNATFLFNIREKL